jgi:hypothetical protein
MAEPKLAATVIVGVMKENAFRVLMVKRRGKARFMPSVHVFPGEMFEWRITLLLV